MATKNASGDNAQKVEAPVFAASAEKDKGAQKKLQRILAERMQAVEKFGKMTPKMQRGFDRFAANIAALGKE